jgi:hypothetical protein
LVIGAEVGTDIFGPIDGISFSTFRDKASGYGNSALMKNGKSANELLIIIGNLLSHYAKFHHHSKFFNVPIEVLKADFESVYRSKAINQFCNDQGITIEFSSPHAHEYNDLIESHNKIIANKVTTFYASAPWVYQSLWHCGWRYADLTENLTKTKRNHNIKRSEEFQSIKPNMKSTIYFP